MPQTVFSIDQNSHSLWDVVPKVQALVARGYRVCHFVEDVDVAFTAVGAGPGEALRIARERFHRSGGADWGAAIFYFEFLGRQPVEIRDWEPFMGMKISALAKRLGCSADELYDRFSPSDNWQLIGPSYLERRDYHRIIGDVSVREAAPFLREILTRGEADTSAAFPSTECRQRTRDWFAQERSRLEGILAGCAEGRLTDVYRRWLAAHVPAEVALNVTSSLFATKAAERTALLEIFTRDYDAAAAAYNQAIQETHLPLHPLRTDAGELPFFASLEHRGHRVRAAAHLRSGRLHLGPHQFALPESGGIPVDELARAGVFALTGKAVLLVLQARVEASGAPLALPHRGSPYMPAAHRLAALLLERGLLAERPHPVLRLRLHFLDRLHDISNPIRLPPYLAAAFGKDEIPAAQLAHNYEHLIQEAADRLESFRTEAGRQAWQRDSCPHLIRRIDELDGRRRQLAQAGPDPQEIRGVWKELKAAQTELLSRTVEQIACDWQVRELDYWDSRGAILPWSIALGGRAFYDALIAGAEIREESQ